MAGGGEVNMLTVVITHAIAAVIGIAAGAVAMWYINKRQLYKKVRDKVVFYRDDLEAKAKELEKDLKALKDVKVDDMDEALKKIRDKVKDWM
jgi:uncharacterized membrane-anchored protein YhcB (DUF1043 family)